jgi:hypothetical protein
MLEKQLILKGITTPEDWSKIVDDIKFNFAKDNYFGELKDAEILEGRINQARNIQDMVGKYYSHDWVRKNILQQSDDDIADMDKEISVENKSGDVRWVNPAILNNEQMAQQAQMADQQDQAQQQQMLQPGVEGAQGGPDPETQQRIEQLRNAQIIVDQIKKMPKANRTMADEAKYKAAVQVIAKNQGLMQQVSAAAPQQTQQ